MSRRLATAVLRWWGEHEYDEDNGYNRYDETPEFVKIAQDEMRPSETEQDRAACKRCLTELDDLDRENIRQELCAADKAPRFENRSNITTDADI